MILSVTVIHLIGSEGFIGKAIQRQAITGSLNCWSHSSRKSANYFDLANAESWQSLLKCKPKTVILLSWPGLPNYNNPFHITKNLPATIELIEQLVCSGLEKIVIAGTCYEYGLQNGEMNESQNTDPVNYYAIAKDSVRRAVTYLCENSKVNLAWLRIFYPYGEGQNPNSLLPSLENAIKAREPFFSMSSGRQLRDFISVENVADKLLLLASHPTATGIYNAGTGKPQSVREILESRIKSLGSPIILRPGDIPDRLDEPLASWAGLDRWQNLELPV